MKSHVVLASVLLLAGLLAGGLVLRWARPDPQAELLGRLASDQRGTIQFERAPLRQVIDEISRQYNVPLEHEFQSLGDDSIDAQIPVTIDCQDQPLLTVLDHLTRSAAPMSEVVVREGKLVLTSPNIASREPHRVHLR